VKIKMEEIVDERDRKMANFARGNPKKEIVAFANKRGLDVWIRLDM